MLGVQEPRSSTKKSLEFDGFEPEVRRGSNSGIMGCHLPLQSPRILKSTAARHSRVINPQGVLTVQRQVLCLYTSECCGYFLRSQHTGETPFS